VLEDQFSDITEIEKAVLLKARNQTGSHYMPVGSDTSEWHYQGSCEEVILNREVKLEFTQYCCEFGFPRVNCAFPAKIESVITVEESQ
jgi:hypothetical protein